LTGEYYTAIYGYSKHMTTTTFLEKGERVTAVLRGGITAYAGWVPDDPGGLAPAEMWGRLVDVVQPPTKAEEQFLTKTIAVPQQMQLYSNEPEACCALDVLDMFPVRTPSSTMVSEQTANSTDELCCHDRILKLIVSPLTLHESFDTCLVGEGEGGGLDKQ
jgi:hypothetical protein